MIDRRTDLEPTPGDLDAVVGRSDMADWIDADPVPALQHFREELLALSASGAAPTEPVADRLVDVIDALREVGDTLRDDDALPSALEAALAHCAKDLDAARSLVDRARTTIDDRHATTVSDAARERVREARASRTDPSPRDRR